MPCAALRDADRRFRKYRFMGGVAAPPLSRKERNDLKLLRRLYPAGPKPDLSHFGDDEFDMYRYHPFAVELPAPDGNFYPPRFKLRPPDLLS
jgi:hypothetical protein